MAVEDGGRGSGRNGGTGGGGGGIQGDICRWQVAVGIRPEGV